MRRVHHLLGGRGVVAALRAAILGLVPTGLATAQPAPPPPGVEPSPDRHESTRRVLGEDHPDTTQGDNSLAESQPDQRASPAPTRSRPKPSRSKSTS